MPSISWSDTPSTHTSFEELSVQSLDAAIELGRLQHGHDVEVGAIHSLAKNLGFDETTTWSADTIKRFVDPKTVDIYSRAVTHLGDAPPSTITELAAKIREIASAFSRDVKVITGDDLKRMRDFCLALHRELLVESNERQAENSPERF